MAADALAKTRTSNRAGEVGPDIYAEWRASTLGAITELLEQELVLDLAGPLFGKSVLDVGCGDGTLAAEFHRKGASFVVGCDPDPHMIAKATARTMAERDGMSYLLGRAEHLPFRDQSFDVVTAVTVLCFVEQRSRAVEEMARVLKPGGRLVIGGLGRWSTWAASRRVRAWLGNEFWRHARFTTARRTAHRRDRRRPARRSAPWCGLLPALRSGRTRNEATRPTLGRCYDLRGGVYRDAGN